MLDKNMAILDGMHRLSCSIRFGEETIPVAVYNRISDRYIGREFFLENNFSREEISFINDTYSKLLCDIKYNYFGIIWPPAMDYADEILTDLNCIDSDSVKVVSFSDYVMSKDEFEDFFRMIYRYDYFTGKPVEDKLSLIYNSARYNGTDKLRFRLFELELRKPEIIINQKSGVPKSNTVTRYKLALRKRYEKKIYEYSYDVIIHVADNYITSKALKLISGSDCDLSELFDRMNCIDIDYAVLKTDGSMHQRKNFPKGFALGKDIDMIISDADLQEALELIEFFLRDRFDDKCFKLSSKSVPGKGCQVEVTLFDRRIIMFDLMTTPDYMTKRFTDEALSEAYLDKEHGFKRTSQRMECLCRLVAFSGCPAKKWHLEYLREHMDSLSERNIDKFVDDSRVLKRSKIIIEDRANGNYLSWRKIN